MEEKMKAALNRLCKWRTILAGWQLGTRPDTDPECQAVRDHRDATLILRAEVTALAALLIRKNVFTDSEFMAQITIEADYLSEAYAKRFPGAVARDYGMVLDKRAHEWMKNWRP